jgi:hypothetical protein
MVSSYTQTLERKITEVFEHLEVDPKRALKVVQKEIESRGKKIQPSELTQLRIVRALVLEESNRIAESRSEVLSVLEEIKQITTVDHYVLDTFLKTTARMQERTFYQQEYFKVIEILHGKNPKDKELTHSLYTGSLMNGQFGTAAKMAQKMVQQFDEPSFALPHIELLYMDS